MMDRYPNVGSTTIDEVADAKHESLAFQPRDVVVTTGSPLILPKAYLEWYEFRGTESLTSRELSIDARSFLAQEISLGRLTFDRGLGFVVLVYLPPVLHLLVGAERLSQVKWQVNYGRNASVDGWFTRSERASGVVDSQLSLKVLGRRDRELTNEVLADVGGRLSRDFGAIRQQRNLADSV